MSPPLVRTSLRKAMPARRERRTDKKAGQQVIRRRHAAEEVGSPLR